ncbi:hypothetical protein MCC93_16480 [Morococcus cerebrosus]|uniref:Uncharacterized protein n=1 Tax=Morococcus cerebrosus TaxID=1056807 RepID=A0A0C1GKE8_9NEIS|nr:hypothetical protein MCC93_16480 [Morococcus cerebrosus]KJJ16729.1 hypothetical protein HMPREF3156_01393 [Neisseria sp. HMSC06F02]
MLQYQINLASISKGRLKTQISGFQTTFTRQTHIIKLFIKQPHDR